MGLSASQARFLQLTARRSDVEYEAQQINFQRLQLADKLSAASSEYQDKTSNRKMVFSFNNGAGTTSVDVTYQNYKNYMNQQMEGLSTSQEKMFLVSSSGNKLVVANEEERNAMIEKYTTYTPLAQNSSIATDENGNPLETITREDENGSNVTYLVNRQFNESDFMIVDNLDDTDLFQQSIQNGIYYFAKQELNTETNKYVFKTESWETIGGGAIGEEYNKSDDAKAEAEYKATNDKLQSMDKKLELKLTELETERNAIQTEIDSVSKVIDDNVEKSFNTFS